ncbi:hypothetical protein K432DRAFT_208407 [Lepidopterella palustris CBS 459.81]|uniref:Uncharacterized protein n=1 Tax=Lepidopterella palustris CBS 459.81 TaxID=1314670 RepID=A0A8E2JHL9_9PEZI|nr:hypothetical protein K432DRAFT_208407 [Lepidopterella palustris CBS 459.81]
MRKLKSPRGYCSFGHRGLLDGLFESEDHSKPFNGPFDTESDLNEAMVARYVKEGLSIYKAEHFLTRLQGCLPEPRPSFHTCRFPAEEYHVPQSPDDNRKRPSPVGHNGSGACDHRLGVLWVVSQLLGVFKSAVWVRSMEG